MRKDLLTGIVVGSLLFSTTCSFSAVTYNALKATFPIFVDGKELKCSDKTYVIDGTTYLPLKSIGEALNTNVKWNDELNRVEIGTCELDEEILFDEDYWYTYYENYYKELFSELYDENVKISEIENSGDYILDQNEESDSHSATYIGNKSTKKLHLSTCKSANKLSESNKVYFSDIADVKGYTKCKICNP